MWWVYTKYYYIILVSCHSNFIRSIILYFLSMLLKESLIFMLLLIENPIVIVYLFESSFYCWQFFYLQLLLFYPALHHSFGFHLTFYDLPQPNRKNQFYSFELKTLYCGLLHFPIDNYSHLSLLHRSPQLTRYFNYWQLEHSRIYMNS